MQSKVGRLGAFLALFALAAGLVRLTFVRGLIAPFRVVGGSMAESLRGDHFELPCSDCRFIIRWDQEDPPTGGRAICPNCGHVEDSLDQARVRPGDQARVDRWPALLGSIRRWDLVALQTPGQADKLSLKRVVGLPGEQVSIRDGELYINGKLLRKSPEIQRELAVLVHDDNFRPATASLPARWQPQADDSAWRVGSNEYFFEPPQSTVAGSKDQASDDLSAVDWLTYRNWRCFANLLPRSDESPILDRDAYNQNTARELNDVADLMLRCRLTAGPGSRISIVCNNGWETVEAVLVPGRAGATLRVDTNIVDRGSSPLVEGRECIVELAVYDRRVCMMIDGRLLFDCPYERRNSGRLFQPTSRPFAIGAAGGYVALRTLQVYRDTYYLDPDGLTRPWSRIAPLGADEWFVLGDNPAVSQDSRQWEQPIKSRAIVGRVIRL